jgi:hypothetical protein
MAGPERVGDLPDQFVIGSLALQLEDWEDVGATAPARRL